MVVALADERALGRDAKPEVPVQARRHLVLAVRGPVLLPLPPFLAAPAVDPLPLAEGPRVDRGGNRPVLGCRVDLSAHLGDELPATGREPELPGLIDRLGQR